MEIPHLKVMEMIRTACLWNEDTVEGTGRARDQSAFSVWADYQMYERLNMRCGMLVVSENTSLQRNYLALPRFARVTSQRKQLSPTTHIKGTKLGKFA
jgi:hypothetical protein